MVRRVLLVVVSAIAAGCGGGRALKIEIHNPCNSTAFSGNNVSYVELSVDSPELDAPIRATFGAGEASGSLDDVTAVSKATIEVAGHAAASDGGVGDVVVAGGLGYLDLSTGDGTYKLMPGKVTSFVRTTTTRGDSGLCVDQAAARSWQTASTLTDGRVLVVGGSNDSSALASTEIYSPESGAFTSGPNMRSARMAHTATTLIDGRVLIAGGYDADSEPVSSVEVFDSSAFQRAVTMDARAYHTATRLQDGRVLLAGGMDTSGVIASTAIYNPKNESITDGPTLKAPRARHSAVLVDDAVVALIGGIDDTSVVGITEFVNVDSDTSISGPSLETPRSDAVVGFLTNKREIVIAGGYADRVSDIVRGTAIANIEVLQVADSVAASTIACSDASMLEARAAAAIAPVSHGFVVMGGVNEPGQVSATAEILTFDADPCRLTITAAQGSMYASRYGAGVATLAGGDILVTGGAGVSKGSVLSRNAAEIFIVPR